MATSLDKVYLNFVWKIETLSPSSKLSRNKFRLDDRIHMTSQQTATDRLFAVYWDGSDALLAPTDMYQRRSEHKFTIEVTYSTKRNLTDLTNLAQLDAHDIIRTLRNDASWIGYSKTNSNTSIGLEDREFEGQELDRSNEQAWILRQRWRCTVKEVEQ